LLRSSQHDALKSRTLVLFQIERDGLLSFVAFELE